MYQSVGAEYVTGQVNSLIVQLFLDNFTIRFLHRLKNLNMLQSDETFSQQPQKIF